MNNKNITVTVNGEPLIMDNGASINCVIEKLGLTGGNLIAELDGNIIKKIDFKTTSLENGAKLELIKFVGGG